MTRVEEQAEAATATVEEWQWLTTESNPRTPATGHDAGQRGWRLHAVTANEGATFSSVRGRRAACGLIPRHGWSLDLFIEEKCTRCLRALNRLVLKESIRSEP